MQTIKRKLTHCLFVAFLMQCGNISLCMAQGDDINIDHVCRDLKNSAFKLQSDGAFELSIREFEKARDICPDDPLLEFQYGVTLILIGKTDSGLTAMEEAILMAECIGNIEAQFIFERERECWISWINGDRDGGGWCFKFSE